MNDDDILSSLRDVAREHLNYEGPLYADSVLVDALRLDSLRLLTLVVEVENRFGVTLEEGDETGLVTAADLVHVLRTRLGP